MFHMTQVGIRIATLRRDRDITQISLADQLGISHQAVSKWERGESMPDISTLPLLAEIFGVSVDYILTGNTNSIAGSGTRIIREIIEHGALEQLDEEVTMEDVNSVAPLLKPSQIKEVMGKVKEASIDGLMGLAPFLDRELLDSLVSNAIFDGELGELYGLAPFISREKLDVLASRISQEFGIEELCGLAPFLSRDALDGLAEKASVDCSIEVLCGLAPFLSRSILDEIAMKATVDCNVSVLCGMAPFLSRGTLDEIAKKATFDGDFAELSGLAPFLSNHVMMEIIKRG